MAWLLIRAFDDAHVRSWKLGDIVEVRPDGFTGWGALETLPRFYRVQVTGLDAVKAKQILEASDSHEEIQPDQTFRTVIDRVRNWAIKPADVPAGARALLQSTGQLVITKAQAATFIKNNLGGTVSLP